MLVYQGTVFYPDTHFETLTTVSVEQVESSGVNKGALTCQNATLLGTNTFPNVESTPLPAFAAPLRVVAK